MKRHVRHANHSWVVCALLVGVAACAVEGSTSGDDDDPIANMPVCGNKQCETGENAQSCAADCGPTVTCGDMKCEAGETAQSCAADCGTTAQCGNMKCEAGETAQSCAADCGTCGNTVCEANEATTCPNDCPASLRVQNNSSYTVYNLYVRACTGNWSADQTGSSYIPPGYAFTLTGIPPGCWYFRATTAGDVQYWQTPSGVTLTPSTQYLWTLVN